MMALFTHHVFAHPLAALHLLGGALVNAACLVLTWGALSAANTAHAAPQGQTALAFELVELTVDLGSGVEIPADIFLPREVVPKALVLVVPGSDGQADPFLGSELAKPTYDPSHRGGWLKPLLQAGYAVAFFPERGYRRLRHCITGRTSAEHYRAFADQCVVGAVRAKAALNSVTPDFAKVMSTIAAHPSVRGLTPMVLALSLGLHHTSVIVGRGQFAPAAVVGVGGAMPDLRTLMEYQSDRVYFIRALERAFHVCPRRRLAVDDVLKCSGLQRFPEVADLMRQTMGAETLDAIEFAHRRGFWAGHHHRERTLYMNQPHHAVMGARFGGVDYPMGWSVRHLVQMFESHRPVLQQFGNFAGPVILLYGSAEHLMPLPRSGLCGHRRPDRLPLDCEVRHLPGLGHGLHDESGHSPPWAIAAIVRALDDGLTRFKAKAAAGAARPVAAH